MRILLLADGMYPFILGGMQKHSYSMAKYLSLSGVKVDIIQYVFELPIEKPLNQKEFEDFNKENTTIKSILFPISKKIPGHYLRSNLKFSSLAWETVKDNIQQYDFIYAQGFTGYHFILEKLKNKHQVPIGVNFHGFEMFQKAPSLKVRLQHQLFRKKVKWICANADHVISYGGKITTLIQNLGISKNKILESPMGLDDTWFENPPKTFEVAEPIKLLFIGRFERRKGVEELTATLKKLLLDSKNIFEFHFIGPIPDDKKIMNKQIIYHGMIKQQERIQEISKQCDVLVCPSYSEGMPTVILEGMASGNAILATDVGAVALYFQENGWLLKEPKADTIYASLKTIISTPNTQLQKMKENSFLKASSEFKWSEIVKKLIQKIKS